MGQSGWKRCHIALTSRRTSILQMEGVRKENIFEDRWWYPCSLFEYECNDPEQDIIWAILTVAFIQVRFVEIKGVNMPQVPCVVLFIKQSLQFNSLEIFHLHILLPSARCCPLPLHYF